MGRKLNNMNSSLNLMKDLRSIRQKIAESEYENRDMETEDPAYVEHQEDRHRLELFLTESQVSMLLSILEKEADKVEKEINKIEENPSWNSIRDDRKKESRLQKVATIRKIIAEVVSNAW